MPPLTCEGEGGDCGIFKQYESTSSNHSSFTVKPWSFLFELHINLRTSSLRGSFQQKLEYNVRAKSGFSVLSQKIDIFRPPQLITLEGNLTANFRTAKLQATVPTKRKLQKCVWGDTRDCSDSLVSRILERSFWSFFASRVERVASLKRKEPKKTAKVQA